MTKPENFILNSDYATVKNDATGTMTLNIPSGTTIPASSGSSYGLVNFETFLDIGETDAGIRGYISTTKFSGIYAPFGGSYNVRVLTRYNTTGTPVFDLYFTVILERVSPTRLRLYCQIGNSFSFSLTIMDSQTITFDLATFLSPLQ